MGQEIESLLTGLAGSLNQYMGLNIQNKMEERKAERKMASDMVLEDYKSKLDLSNKLAVELGKKELNKGKFINSQDVNKLPGLEFLPDGVELQPSALLTFIAGMNKTKNKQGKVPMALLKDEATLASQESMLKQLEFMLAKNQAGIPGALNSAAATMTRGNFGIPSPFGVGGVTKKKAEDARNYNEMKKAVAVMAYRAVTGDTRLSDADAADRGYPLVPDLSESMNVRTQKMNAMKKGLKKLREANIQAQRKAMANSGASIDLGVDNPYADMSNEELIQQLQESGVIGD